MKTFLDPLLFVYSEVEWRNYYFVDRLGGLVKFLDALLQIESRQSSSNQSIKLQISDDIINQLYNSSALLNDPPRNFYNIQFRNVVVPGLMRRFSICPTDKCDSIDKVVPAIWTVLANDGVVRNFREHVDICGKCIRGIGAQYIRDSIGKVIANDSVIFDHPMECDASAAWCIFSYEELFTSAVLQKDAVDLALCIECYINSNRVTEPEFGSRSPSPLRVSDEFWTSIQSANFREREGEYVKRIVRALSQICVGIDLDINAHGMNPQQFRYEGSLINRWNAYVFQEGPGPGDDRCSRLYYGFHNGGVVLNRYEPDAH